MKKTLVLILTVCLLMCAGSAMADTLTKADAIETTGTDYSTTLATTYTADDPTIVAITWDDPPTLLTYKWDSTAHAWTCNSGETAFTSADITFTAQNDSPKQKRVVGTWSQETTVSDALTALGLTAEANSAGIFTPTEGNTGVLLASNANNAAGKVTLSFSSITLGDKTPAVATGESLTLGTVTINIANN